MATWHVGVHFALATRRRRQARTVESVGDERNAVNLGRGVELILNARWSSCCGDDRRLSGLKEQLDKQAEEPTVKCCGGRCALLVPRGATVVVCDIYPASCCLYTAQPRRSWQIADGSSSLPMPPPSRTACPSRKRRSYPLGHAQRSTSKLGFLARTDRPGSGVPTCMCAQADEGPAETDQRPGMHGSARTLAYGCSCPPCEKTRSIYERKADLLAQRIPQYACILIGRGTEVPE